MTHILKNDVPPDAVIDEKQIDLAIASAYSKEGKYAEALEVASGVLNKDPNSAAALFIVAWAFIKMERYGIAYNLLKRSLQAKDRHEAWNNLAMACIGMQRLDEAEMALRKALKRAGEYTHALNNLALIAVYNCQPERAIEYGERSLAQNSEQWDVREAIGYAKLMRGDWVGGWAGYEAMIGRSKPRPNKPPHADCPYLKDETGLDLYIRGEQGIGDEISFASILPDAVRDHRSVTVECHPKMAGLLQRSFPAVEFHGTRETGTQKYDRSWLEDRHFDAWCLMGSLAAEYRVTDESFPGTPFLVADPQRRVQWRALLDTLPGKKIGIAWTGGLPSTFRDRRSFSLEGLLPILRTPGVSWVSLQYEDPTMELEHFKKTHGIDIHHWKRAAESDDYDDQAALVAELDMVISVCTAVVHLSGALGKECWCLVPEKPRWWYRMKGDRVPWYSSVEMFRQSGHAWPVDAVSRRLGLRLEAA